MANSSDPRKQPKPQPEPEPQPASESAAEVDLGQPAADQPPSGESSTVWADLVKDPSTGGSTGPSAQFDSPSDASVIERAEEEEGTLLAEVDEEAVGGVVPPGAESSRVDLFEQAPGLDPLQSKSHERSGLAGSGIEGSSGSLERGAAPAAHGESGIDLGSAAVIDIAEASPAWDSGIDLSQPSEEPVVLTGTAAAESGIDVGEAAVIDIAEGSTPHGESGLELGSAEVVDVTDASSSALDLGVNRGARVESSEINLHGDIEGAVLAPSSSAIDLGGVIVIEGGTGLPPGSGEKLPPSSESDLNVGADEPVDLGGAVLVDEAPSSSINLDVAGPKNGSSRDLIAEAVESGVDLGKGGTVEDEDQVLLGSGGDQSRTGPSSSAVDLGAAVLIEEEPPIAGDLGLEQFAPPGAAEVVVDSDPSPAPPMVEDSAESLALEDEKPDAAPSTTPAEEGLGADVEAEVEIEAEGEAKPEEGPKLFEDEEGEAAAVGEDEEKPAPPVRQRGTGLAWVGGILVGGLLAAAGVMGVVVFNEEIPGKVRDLIGLEDENASAKNDGKGGDKKQGGGQPKQADVRELLKTAEFTREAPPINEDNGDDRVARGTYRWLQSLSKGQVPKADAPEVKAALDDLKAAEELGKNTSATGGADALFWKGQIYETLGNRDEAEKTYKQGAERFKADPAQKARFDGCLDRLDVVLPVKAPAPPPGPGAGARAPTIDYHPLGLALLIAQAPPGGGEKPPAGPPPEAGFDFWKAVKLANQQKYDEALKLLDEARKKHDARRLTQVLKPQNPTSDPTEQIFLKTCDELRLHWQLLEKLRSGGYLAANQPDPGKALEKLFADIKALNDAGGDLKKALATLTEDKKKADAEIVTLKTDLDKEKKEKADAQAILLKTQKDLEDEKKALAAEKMRVIDSQAIVDRVQKQKKNLEETIVGAGDKVGLRDIDPVRSKDILYQKLDDLVNVANTKDPQKRIADSIVEVRDLNATLAQRWSPEVMLGYWTPLLADRDRKDETGPALEDARRVKANPKAPLEVRSQAYAVEGLALRNRGEFGKAREALTEAMRGDVAGPTWKPVAKVVLGELTDPAASYLPRAEALRARRDYDGAIAVLDEGVKIFADKAGDLLALRSQVRLDKALAAQPRPTEATPGLKEALDDADAALKAGSQGAGQFAAARLAEALGQKPEAEQLYRKAAAALPEDHPDAVRAKIAVGRLLLEKVETKPAPEPMPKTSRAPGVKIQRVGRMPVPSLAALAMAQPPSPEDEAKIKEAIKLADEVLARKDIDQFPLLKAQALSVKGQWTEALNTYVRGLQPYLSREHHEGLKYLVENHPLQRRPDRLRIPHPMQGEKHYGQGLSRFFDRDFATAEREFTKAIENFDQDARYFYYLGLARMAQGKREAAENFEQGARLEADNHPSSAAVNAALERIQGTPRRMINEARERVR